MIDEAVGENRPEGIMQYVKCPDCTHRLIPLSKINEEGVSSGVKAKVCSNKECWRYIADFYLMTWKRRQ